MVRRLHCWAACCTSAIIRRPRIGTACMSRRKNEERMMKRKVKSRWLIAAGLCCMATVASAEDVYVKLPIANVLSGKGAGTDRVAQVKQGDKLQVVGKEG